jgi:hypothetical protein
MSAASSTGLGGKTGRGRQTALAALLTVAAFLVLAAPALAGKVQAGYFAGNGPAFDGSGSADGQLLEPGQADVNDGSGYVYVADTGNNRVQAFKPTAELAEYDSQVAITAPTGLAIDQSTGDVYVANASGVAKFDEDLAPIASGWTAPTATGALAVDPSSGDLLVADTAGNLIRRFDSDGTALGTFAAQRPVDLAANSEGEIFVVTTSGNLTGECGPTSQVVRFSGAGANEGTVGASLVAPGAVAVDPDDDSIVIAAHVNEYVCEQGFTPEIVSFDAGGVQVEAGSLSGSTSEIGAGSGMYAMVPGLAAPGGDSSRIYVVTKSPADHIYGATMVAVLAEVAPQANTMQAFAFEGGSRALLAGRVNPRNQPTDYWFEYGLDTDYGSSVPAGEDGDAGSGTASVLVEQETAGLAAETTYHYRMVAENATGVRFGDDMTFTTTSASAPPVESCDNATFRAQQGASLAAECRAWEKVSPLDKNNLDAGGSEFSPAPVQASPDGNRAVYFADGGFGDSKGASTGNGYLSTREGGWSSTGLIPPIDVTTTFGNFAPFEEFVSTDVSRSLVSSKVSLTADTPDTQPDPWNLYVYDSDTGEYELLTLTDPTDAPLDGMEPPWVATASPDLRRVLFYSYYAYTPDAPSGGAFGSPPNLYEWRSGNPELRLVGHLPGSGTGIRSFLGGQSNNGQNGSAHNAVSEDGSRIYFNAPSDGGGTYLSEDGVPKLVSPTGTFWTATPDGSEALIVKGGTIWRYDATAETFTDLVPDSEPSDGADPGVAGLMGNSEDLSVVYFIADRAITPGVQMEGKAHIYVSDEGEVKPIGVIGDATESDGAGVAGERGSLSQDRGYPFGGNRATTADGSMLVFASAQRLTAYDNHTRSEVYAYDNTVDQLSCLSCRPDGALPAGNAVLSGITTPHGALTSVGLYLNPHNISDDASRIFFHTSDSIVPEDTNGTNDVYVWDGGRASLITSGIGEDREGSFFKSATPSGDDVFFSTRDKLVTTDTDKLGDIYDARVNGGLPAQMAVAAVAPCEGSQCRGASSVALPATSPASREIRGAQNAKPKKNKKQSGKKNKHKKKGKGKQKGKNGKKHNGKKHKRAGHRAERNG